MQHHVDDCIGLTRRVLAQVLAEGRERTGTVTAVDATAGNGHDTLFLASHVELPGRVWAFDIQEEAVHSTRERLLSAGKADRVTLVHAGHEALARLLPWEARGHVWAVTFNLGFLPGSDRNVVTKPETTLVALKAVAPLVAEGGVISVHVYRGHSGGEEEGKAVEVWFRSLPWSAWRVAAYSFMNKPRNYEVLYLAERIG